MTNCTARSWSTEAFAAVERYDAWAEQLSGVYGAWRPDRSDAKDFSASVLHHDRNGFQLVECRCDPCGAVRTRADTVRGDSETLAIQLALSGREIMTIGGQTAELTCGDLIIWDTTQEMRFEVLEPLHKITVMLPLARLKCWMPQSWQTMDRKLPVGSVQADLLASYIAAIRPGFMDGNLTNATGLTEATIGLLINALGADTKIEPESLRDSQMVRIRNFIERNLDDAELTPGSIAAACRISVRYLHWVFEPTGTTVLKYVIQQRLIRCRRELSNPTMLSRSITDIAFSSGFHNATHFSRRFKSEFGLTPQDFRSEVCGVTK